uniref:Interleukin 19 n=1 Tax=Buteo japonicus TaxID=224669 RepID=A0A8B9Z1G4_9AVES
RKQVNVVLGPLDMGHCFRSQHLIPSYKISYLLYRCCITHHLFDFYVDKVFKHCKTEDSYVNRKISSIANSFLSVKRKLEQCHEENKCLCGEESTEKFKQILANYEGLNVTSAAIKSLGELDILLDWMEKSH